MLNPFLLFQKRIQSSRRCAGERETKVYQGGTVGKESLESVVGDLRRIQAELHEAGVYFEDGNQRPIGELQAAIQVQHSKIGA